ncbi:MAG: rRNA maturation RNase YbeY [Candidatus Paceibacteria bacterium]
MKNNFSITKTIKGKLPSLPFENMKNEVLGKNYELSLVFIGTKKSQALNKKYRKKNKPADVLSFPLSKSTGEIFICPKTTKQESIGSLFIHGLMHLKGLRHGSTMERAEKKVRLKFSI